MARRQGAPVFALRAALDDYQLRGEPASRCGCRGRRACSRPTAPGPISSVHATCWTELSNQPVDLVLHSAALPYSSPGGENALVHPRIPRITRLETRSRPEVLVFILGARACRHRLCDGLRSISSSPKYWTYTCALSWVSNCRRTSMRPNPSGPTTYPVAGTADCARVEPLTRRVAAGDLEIDSLAPAVQRRSR